MPTIQSIIRAENLRPPLTEAIVNASGVPTDAEQKFRTNLNRLLISMSAIDVTSFGARGDGSTDDTFAVQTAINQAIKQGGGVVTIPAGTYSIFSVFIPKTAPPITIVGQGFESILKRRGVIASGTGLLDISASNIDLENFAIDAATTVPVGLRYNADFLGIGGNDPMADSLTRNTSLWLHGPAVMLSCYRVLFTHAAGYSVILDAMTGNIADVDFINCFFYNNRPTLFGMTDLIYGSWNGGLLAKGDGRTVTSGTVDGLLVTQCRFKRNTGNCLWSHLYGLNTLHEDFRFEDNYFEDDGLDGILVAGVSGGNVEGNTFNRIGYICLADTGPGTPRWLANLNATALDSAGIVKGVPYVANSFRSINGGCMDLDGHGQSVISANQCRVPYVDEPEYVEDQIAICGPTNSGSVSYGLNLNNSNQSPEGACNIKIAGNEFINLRGGSMRLYAARRVAARNNQIIAPPDSLYTPVLLGPTGSGPYQRCYDCKVQDNDIDYSPVAPAPTIAEDDSQSGGHPFTGGEKNTVCGNTPITGNGNASEFQKAAGSGSTVYAETVWFP